MMLRLKQRLEELRRVFSIARKPEWEEYARIAKICAIGIAAVGLIGFAFYLVLVLIT